MAKHVLIKDDTAVVFTFHSEDCVAVVEWEKVIGWSRTFKTTAKAPLARKWWAQKIAEGFTVEL